jgi:hypothetical protein
MGLFLFLFLYPACYDIVTLPGKTKKVFFFRGGKAGNPGCHRTLTERESGRRRPDQGITAAEERNLGHQYPGKSRKNKKACNSSIPKGSGITGNADNNDGIGSGLMTRVYRILNILS